MRPQIKFTLDTMLLGLAAPLGLVACLGLMTASVLAQDYPPPMPDTGAYGAPQSSAPAGAMLPAPDADPGGDGSSVVVPIPGGGEVSAEGPALDMPTPVPPTETWTTQGQTPNSVGGLPIGP